MQQLILAIDQGTTSTRAILFDRSGKIIRSAQKEFPQYYPQPGWVEHDAEEIWSSVRDTITGLISLSDPAGIPVCAGLTNQRETIVLWDKKTGKPVHRAIVWQDRRTSSWCDEMKRNGYEKMIASKTGLVIDAYFSATKIKWILDHTEGLQRRAENGEIAAGTIDSWILFNLSQGKLHVTDVSNASRTLLFNIHTLKWDDDLLKLFGIPACMLPEVRSSSEYYGEAKLNGLSIPVCGIAGDQQAALFGHQCLTSGTIKNTYGTGCFLMMNTGETPVISKNRMLTTIAWQIKNTTTYALEGSVFVAGALVQWLRDGLGLISRSADIETLASQCNDNGGVYIVPAFAGLGAPYWDQHARGIIAGLTRGTRAAHIARATLESIAYQTYDVLKAMQEDTGISIPSLRADGGASANNLLLQFQSSLLGIPVIRPSVTETTALGAAWLAGLGAGLWPSADKTDLSIETTVFYPQPGNDFSQTLKQWHKAVEKAKGWLTENY